ncbi:MAG TPA: radical SAM family heme chaperone HemW [Candidatus Limnocylindria bacterium]|nr:radical SAM family heme chaperone HemW [Candidatus Limnocylindria bacterium]
MSTADNVALYVHVPWCRHVCPYCDFNVRARRLPPEADDLAAFAAELDAWVTVPPFAGARLGSVFIGGGTPSLYSPHTVSALLERVARRFAVADDAEVTLEANPGTLDGPRLHGFRAAGVNRLSLGAQSFDAGVLRVLGRDHTPADISAAVAASRAAGFANVSLDLVYGVPGQTLAQWARDLDAALALEPEHVSTYALTWEPGTPFQRWRETGRLVAVDEDDECAMADLACERLAAAGYERYEISSHAQPGFASRHNQRYWDGSSYLGIGPGAHSFAALPLPGRRWANERDPARYRDLVARHGTAVAAAEDLSLARAESDFVITGLRRLAGVDRDAFRRRFGRPLEDALPQVAALEAEAFVERVGERLRLTARGLRFVDSVWTALL